VAQSLLLALLHRNKHNEVNKYTLNCSFGYSAHLGFTRSLVLYQTDQRRFINGTLRHTLYMWRIIVMFLYLYKFEETIGEREDHYMHESRQKCLFFAISTCNVIVSEWDVSHTSGPIWKSDGLQRSAIIQYRHLDSWPIKCVPEILNCYPFIKDVANNVFSNVLSVPLFMCC